MYKVGEIVEFIYSGAEGVGAVVGTDIVGRILIDVKKSSQTDIDPQIAVWDVFLTKIDQPTVTQKLLSSLLEPVIENVIEPIENKLDITVYEYIKQQLTDLYSPIKARYSAINFDDKFEAVLDFSNKIAKILENQITADNIKFSILDQKRGNFVIAFELKLFRVTFKSALESNIKFGQVEIFDATNTQIYQNSGIFKKNVDDVVAKISNLVAPSKQTFVEDTTEAETTYEQTRKVLRKLFDEIVSNDLSFVQNSVADFEKMFNNLDAVVKPCMEIQGLSFVSVELLPITQLDVYKKFRLVAVFGVFEIAFLIHCSTEQSPIQMTITNKQGKFTTSAWGQIENNLVVLRNVLDNFTKVEKQTTENQTKQEQLYPNQGLLDGVIEMLQTGNDNTHQKAIKIIKQLNLTKDVIERYGILLNFVEPHLVVINAQKGSLSDFTDTSIKDLFLLTNISLPICDYLPVGLFDLLRIEHLDLSAVNIEVLPADIKKLTNLKTLVLSKKVSNSFEILNGMPNLTIQYC